MEINTLKKDGILVFVLSGRFDTNGAAIFDSEIKCRLHADDKSVVIDLKDVSYLSSGGIRVLISLKKEMKKRNGALILASLQSYPSKVLDMTGLLSFFKTEETRINAINVAKIGIEDFSLLDEIKKPSTIRNNIRYTFESGTEKRGDITVKGDVSKILSSDLKEDDIFEEGFDDSYSIGLGSMGINKSDAMNRLGEMINIRGTLACYPTDRSKTPDYFTPLKNTGELVYYSALNIKSRLLFNDIITMEAENGSNISLEALCHDIFSFAYERQKNCRGLIFIVIWGVIGDFYGSRIIKSPISENKPSTGRKITERENLPNWFYINKKPEFQDETMFSAGIVADTNNPDINNYSESVFNSAFYYHPSDENQSRLLSQNHCAIVKNVPWDKNADLTGITKQISESGVITDIRHILMKTTLKKARIGVSYIEKIVKDD